MCLWLVLNEWFVPLNIRMGEVLRGKINRFCIVRASVGREIIITNYRIIKNLFIYMLIKNNYRV